MPMLMMLCSNFSNSNTRGVTTRGPTIVFGVAGVPIVVSGALLSFERALGII
jgi:hypothetical protein